MKYSLPCISASSPELHVTPLHSSGFPHLPQQYSPSMRSSLTAQRWHDGRPASPFGSEMTPISGVQLISRKKHTHVACVRATPCENLCILKREGVIQFVMK